MRIVNRKIRTRSNRAAGRLNKIDDFLPGNGIISPSNGYVHFPVNSDCSRKNRTSRKQLELPPLQYLRTLEFHLRSQRRTSNFQIARNWGRWVFRSINLHFPPVIEARVARRNSRGIFACTLNHELRAAVFRSSLSTRPSLAPEIRKLFTHANF